MAAQAVLKLHDGRCGDSEREHDALKNGIAGGTMPGGRFGANAAWWMATGVAFHLHILAAWWCLDEDLARAACKRIRRVLLDHAIRVIESGRLLILRMRKAGTEERQAALHRLDARSTVPCLRRADHAPAKSRRNRRAMPEYCPASGRYVAETTHRDESRGAARHRRERYPEWRIKETRSGAVAR